MSCRTNASWLNLTGPSTHLISFFRPATIGYSRLNGTILTHTFTGPLTLAPLSPVEILRAASIFFTNPSSDAISSLSNPADFITTFLFTYLYTSEAYTTAGYIGASNRGTTILQAIITNLLYYCQNGTQERIESELQEWADLPNSDLADGSEATGDLSNMFGHAGRSLITRQLPAAVGDNSPTVDIARISYEIVLRPSTLIAYIVLGATAQLLCLIVMVVKTFTRFGRTCPKIGRWGFLDGLRLEFLQEMQQVEDVLDTHMGTGKDGRDALGRISIRNGV